MLAPLPDPPPHLPLLPQAAEGVAPLPHPGAPCRALLRARPESDQRRPAEDAAAKLHVLLPALPVCGFLCGRRGGRARKVAPVVLPKVARPFGHRAAHLGHHLAEGATRRARRSLHSRDSRHLLPASHRRAHPARQHHERLGRRSPRVRRRRRLQARQRRVSLPYWHAADVLLPLPLRGLGRARPLDCFLPLHASLLPRQVCPLRLPLPDAVRGVVCVGCHEWQSSRAAAEWSAPLAGAPCGCVRLLPRFTLAALCAICGVCRGARRQRDADSLARVG
mmetsp:Transcript_66450/g.148361  ORF Transcript_66450/g.148361 Transcript_66450/m.148361 type:complete len:278 (+) Transcript_66450:827-1660(+)